MNGTRRFFVPVLIAGLALPAAAQERSQSELGQVQRQLQQNRVEVERLLDLRVRHDLGLPAEERDDRTFRATVPASTETMERMQQELRDEDAAASLLHEQYEKLRIAVEQFKAAQLERIKASHAEEPVATIPQAGLAPAPGAGVGTAVAAALPGSGPAQPPEAGLPLVAPLEPIVTQIHGSTDHQRVAQALFRAGQELMRVGSVARAQGQPKTAKELDDRGREKLVRAVAELEPLLAGKEPPFAALFYLGRCRELLFRYSELHEQLIASGASRDYTRREQEVREPFLSITARDVVKTGPRGDVEVLGDWGRAAQTAMTNFSWTNQHAGYDATATIKSLTWPGER